MRTRCPSHGAVLPVVAALLVACVRAGGTRGPRVAALAPCRTLAADSVGLCTAVTVPEAWDAPDGRRLRLRVMVLPARGPAAADPVFVVAGGPGQSAIAAAGTFDFLLDSLRARREVVLVDLRGTGGSEPLQCPSISADTSTRGLLGPLFPPEEVRRCRAALEQRADLSRYTTDDATRDIDAVRAALGYGKINLFGMSYGSRVALHYIRRFPSRARTAAVRGVVAPASRIPLYFARDAQDALDSLVGDCAAQPACAQAVPDVRGTLARVLARLDSAPVALPAGPPAGDSVVLTRDAFAERLRLLLYSSQTAAIIPRVLRAAAAADYGPFVTEARAVSTGRRSLALGVYLSVTCSEDIPRITTALASAAAAGTFLGAGRALEHLAACAEWPRRRVDRGYWRPVRSRVPTLLISGDRDPVTPPRWGAEAAAKLPIGRHVVLPGAGHSGRERCVRTLVASHVLSGNVAALDTTCVSRGQRPTFVTTPPPPGR